MTNRCRDTGDSRYAEWQANANHDPDQDIDWRAAQRDRQTLDRYVAGLTKPTPAQWVTLNRDPWASL